MQYRKLKGTKIFNGTAFLDGDNVLILNKDGAVQAIVKEKDAGEEIETLNGIICPGFINAHCHIELSHLKNKIPTHTGLVNFIEQVLKFRGPDKNKVAAMQAAEKELYECGVVAVGDICNTIDSIELKKDSKIYWHNFIETSGFVDAMAQKRMDEVIAVAQLFEEELKKKKQISIVPHAPYSVSKTLFGFINEQSKNKLISIHNQETKTENIFFTEKKGDFLSLYNNLGIDISNFEPSGKTSLQTWIPLVTNAKRIIAVHNTFTSKEDLFFAKQHVNPHKIFYCLCPNANLYIENVLPDINLLAENDITIVLGTDSYASNFSLNIFEEIKTIQNNFPNISLEKILQWATFNGARALGIEDQFGSLHVGKKPGIVLIGDEQSQRII
jgi:aminodeoxyfutalosine deaminase